MNLEDTKKKLQELGCRGLLALLEMFIEGKESGNPIRELGSSSIMRPDAHFSEIRYLLNMQFGFVLRSAEADAFCKMIGDPETYFYFGACRVLKNGNTEFVEPIEHIGMITEILPFVSEDARKTFDDIACSFARNHKNLAHLIPVDDPMID